MTRKEQVMRRAASEAVRFKRDSLLKKCDWTQIHDASVDQEAWAIYRQSLRDITEHVNFPELLEEDWPVKPE
jgi:hypothetical protein